MVQIYKNFTWCESNASNGHREKNEHKVTKSYTTKAWKSSTLFNMYKIKNKKKNQKFTKNP